MLKRIFAALACLPHSVLLFGNQLLVIIIIIIIIIIYYVVNFFIVDKSPMQVKKYVLNYFLYFCYI